MLFTALRPGAQAKRGRLTPAEEATAQAPSPEAAPHSYCENQKIHAMCLFCSRAKQLEFYGYKLTASCGFGFKSEILIMDHP